MTGYSRCGKIYCVYILTNERHTVMYTGVIGDLKVRVYQHREKLLSGFTNRYNVSKSTMKLGTMLLAPAPERSR